MKTLFYISVLFALFFIPEGKIYGQNRSALYEEYIRQYAPLAVSHMEQYKIPASITLAQGLIESGAGRSDLARNNNNHFGIKCHSNWEGDRVFRADDGPNDCFRHYPSVDESFDDHSRFLAERQRYAVLFTYDITDYKRWAKGLQQCGYATDKAYANKLIKVIEDYELYHYDKKKSGDMVRPGVVASDPGSIVTHDNIPVKSALIRERPIVKKQGLPYTTALEHDNMSIIAGDLDIKLDDLLKYNEVPIDFPLQAGDKVYLKKKKSKAEKPYFDHVVQVGESIHSISQEYGVKMSSIYKINKLSPEYIPEEGDVLRLR